MSVVTIPGAMTFTPTPYLPSSFASALLSAISPPFEAL